MSKNYFGKAIESLYKGMSSNYVQISKLIRPHQKIRWQDEKFTCKSSRGKNIGDTLWVKLITN